MNNQKNALWQRASALPVASETDFAASTRRTAGVPADHFRLIKDSQLRARLIGAGLAEGIQSPKGPQRIPSIVRLYPNGDAPARRSNGVSGGAQTFLPSLPTVEELESLLARITQEERAVAGEMQGEINAAIDRLKRRIAEVEGDEFERTYRELEMQMSAKRNLSAAIRDEAFRRVEADVNFPNRRYLRLLSRERREA